jgi:hypothetical protein
VTPSVRARRRAGASIVGAVILATGVGIACAEVGLGPNEAAAIELDPFPSPSVVVGDTLRNIDGVVAAVRARVFNVRGDIIADAAPRYLYADFNIDSALAIDSVKGIVVAKKLSAGDKRIAARIGSSLQVLRPLRIVTRPDSADGRSLTTILGTSLPDTGRRGLDSNSTKALDVTVRHLEAGVVTAARSWPVRFQLLTPANPTNDTMRAAYLIDEQGRASMLDTTDDNGTAGRRVRVRALQFPSGAAVESVVVRATVTYRGQPLKGSPVRMTAPVRRGSGSS